MAKTRTITATFEDGETRTRTTARNYVGVVQGFNGKYFHTHWCGREDLFQKAIKSMVGKYRIARITNDPWAN